MKNRILIVTDCTDIASNELRATLISNLELLDGGEEVEVEPVINVAEFSVLNGDFLSRLIAESYNPAKLTILAVVNPISPSAKGRARIIAELNNGIKLVGANTGIFTSLMNDFGIKYLYESSSEGLKGDSFISFGGKYIHAPYAAKCAVSKNVSELGLVEFPVGSLVKLEYLPGQILHIDNFGVAKLNLEHTEFVPGQKYNVMKNGNNIGKATFCKSMKELDDGELAIYPGSSMDKMELGKVRQLDTSTSMGLVVGDILEFIHAE